jgi:tRNA A37 methylthiotransferase MiaB
MRRPSSIEEIQEKLENLREIPDIFLRTTFLVGLREKMRKLFSAYMIL